MAQQNLNCKDFIEALQNEIDASTEISYSIGGGSSPGNLFVGREIDLDENSETDFLTLFDEGASYMPGGRLTVQLRTVRFVIRKKGSPQAAINDAHTVLEWVEKHKGFTREDFKVQLAEISESPSLAYSHDNGVCVADFAVIYHVVAR